MHANDFPDAIPQIPNVSLEIQSVKYHSLRIPNARPPLKTGSCGVFRLAHGKLVHRRKLETDRFAAGGEEWEPAPHLVKGHAMIKDKQNRVVPMEFRVRFRLSSSKDLTALP